MAYRSMRDFIAALEQQGKLRRIPEEVDRLWEPACLAKWAYQALPDDQRFGLFFEKVAGSDIPLATGLVGGSLAAYAMALGVAPNEINDKWVHALLNLRKPVTVKQASCQEVVRLADDARLGELPIPVWTPGKDAGPYITTNVVTRHAVTGIQNIGVYRTQVRDDHSVVINLNPNRQGYANARSFTDHGKNAPIAWVIAAEPAVHLAAVANLPHGVDEIDVAGGIVGEPIEMVKAKTVDLMVPANSEMVIEGEVIANEYAMEGPFGEFAGYMGPKDKRPVARITAITHRHKPIYYNYTSQMPPSESNVIQSLTNAGVILKMLRHDIGDGNVKDVHIDLTYAGLLGHCLIAITPAYPGHGERVGRLVAAMTTVKRITVVDADVDIRDPMHIDWVMNSRYDPARDTVIIRNVYSRQLDPSVVHTREMSAGGSKVVIDATQKVDAGPYSLPSKDYMMRALESWKKSGLPAFEIPKRAQLRIDHA